MSADPQPTKPEENVEELSGDEPGPPTPPAATQSPTGGAWFNTYFGAEWMAKARQHTMQTLESVRKDLNEFSDTVQNEVTGLASTVQQEVTGLASTVQQEVSGLANASAKVVRTQADYLQNIMTQPETETDEAEGPAPATPQQALPTLNFGWVKSVVDTVKSLAVEDTAQDEAQFTEAVRPPNTRNSALDHIQLFEIQNSESTFLRPPTQNIEMYKDWLKEFKLSEYNGEINILLGNNPKLREIYAKIVPSQVDNHTFWNRYFFKIYVAEMEREIRTGRLFEQLTLDTDAPSASKLNVNSRKGANGESEPSPANTENESWSVCSSGADLQELDDEDEGASAQRSAAAAAIGPLTPKAADDNSPGEEWERFEDAVTNKEATKSEEEKS